MVLLGNILSLAYHGGHSNNLVKSMTQKNNGDVKKSEGGDTIESPMSDENRVPPTLPVEDAKNLESRLKEIKEKDLKGRIVAFNMDLKPLLAKYKLALSAEPFINEGKILAKPVLVESTGI